MRIHQEYARTFSICCVVRRADRVAGRGRMARSSRHETGGSLSTVQIPVVSHVLTPPALAPVLGRLVPVGPAPQKCPCYIKQPR